MRKYWTIRIGKEQRVKCAHGNGLEQGETSKLERKKKKIPLDIIFIEIMVFVSIELKTNSRQCLVGSNIIFVFYCCYVRQTAFCVLGILSDKHGGRQTLFNEIYHLFLTNLSPLVIEAQAIIEAGNRIFSKFDPLLRRWYWEKILVTLPFFFPLSPRMCFP